MTATVLPKTAVFSAAELRSLTIHNALVAGRLSPEEVLAHTHLEGREPGQKQKSLLILTLTVSCCRQGSVASLSFVISIYGSLENN